jgi:hypothetical protein
MRPRQAAHRIGDLLRIDGEGELRRALERLDLATDADASSKLEDVIVWPSTYICPRVC